MTDVNSTYTSLTDAINICLSCIGETPVDAPNNTSTNVVLSKQIIEEVSRDVQSKGWWFNTSGSSISILSTTSGYDADWNESFHADIPEEARRYISIRAARVLQSRFVGSEELQKFSFQEEQVSLAILTQAHVRNGGNSTSFNSFPSELKQLGIEEVMFLQQSAEEKLLSLRLKTELKTADKLAAEASLIADQERLVDQQVATEVQETSKRAAEKDLVDAQKSSVQTETVLRSQQALTELEETSKRAAEKALIDAQELKTDAEKTLVDAQTQTEGYQQGVLSAQTSNLGADSTLKGKQGSLVDKQALDVQADTTLKGKQGDFLDSQKTELDAKTAIDVAAEKAFYDGVVAGTQDTYRDYAAEMRMMGIQESTFQQTPAYKKVELLKDAVKLRTATATETSQNSDEIEQVNKVLRFIGEPPVSTLGDNALASETARLLRDTDKELQGRGWWFNTRKNVEFEPYQGIISIEDDVLGIEVDGIPTHISRYGAGYRLFNRDTNSTTDWNSTIKATVIYKNGLNDVPTKYLEYLNVRTAILLTELYPQSGIDIQRLPKMEQELRAYFKDRQNDEANYSIFDNYDAAARIGINRNYSLI